MTETVRHERDYRAFLDPVVLARIERLDIVAKSAVEGFISGLHRSPYHGFSAEFSEHRQYIAGDPIKHLDWKVLARTNRLYLKRFEDETNLQAYIVLDRSGTMGYGSDISKWMYARMLAASIAYLLLRQRDAVGLALFDTTIRRLIPPRSTPGHLDVLLREIGQTPASEPTDPVACLHRLAERIRRRGLIIIVSDFLLPSTSETDAVRRVDDMANQWDSVLKHFRHEGHDVTAFSVQHPDETEFAFEGPFEFAGLEGEQSMLVDTNAIAHLYRKQFYDYMALLERSCRTERVDFHRLITSDPLDVALAACLDKRRRIR
jgi:uncharacterized protein (DUF58 family)